jgi:hypothetical protein
MTFGRQLRVSVAGFWPDNNAQHRSTMRTSERHLAKSVGICPGRQHPRLSLRISTSAGKVRKAWKDFVLYISQ